MKTKLVPLVLLIPAVVLAQPAPVPQANAGMPLPSAMPAPLVNPVNPVNSAKAAAALSNAKQLSGSLSKEEPKCGSSSITISSGTGSGIYSCERY